MQCQQSLSNVFLWILYAKCNILPCIFYMFKLKKRVDCNCLRSFVPLFVDYHRLKKRVYYRRLTVHVLPIID